MTFETGYAYSEYQKIRKEYFAENNEPYEMVKKEQIIKQMDELIDLMNTEIEELWKLQNRHNNIIEVQLDRENKLRMVYQHKIKQDYEYELNDGVEPDKILLSGIINENHQTDLCGVIHYLLIDTHSPKQA